jgi:RNA-directed DNA polymerase
VRRVAACTLSGKDVNDMGKGRWQLFAANRNRVGLPGQQLEPEKEHGLSEPCAVKSRTHGSSGGKGPRGPYLSQLLHAEVAEVLKAQQLIATWLQGIGLELKPSKTRLSHTLKDYQGNVGFNFLGFTIRQYLVGRTHSGASRGKPLGFKTLIKPSKEGVHRHLQALRRILQRSQSLSQEELIDQLNPVIYGWTLYYRTVVSKKQFTVCDYLLTRMLWQKMTRKHPKKSAKWVKKHYWRTIQGNTWTFATPDETTRQTLRWHAATPIQRHIKVKGQASPFDGNLLYWAKRLKDHPLTKTTLGKLLQKQQGKCRWCELFFREEDQIEIDHITPKREGGGEELSNKFALHRHCHDQKHAKHDRGSQ